MTDWLAKQGPLLGEGTFRTNYMYIRLKQRACFFYHSQCTFLVYCNFQQLFWCTFSLTNLTQQIYSSQLFYWLKNQDFLWLHLRHTFWFLNKISLCGPLEGFSPKKNVFHLKKWEALPLPLELFSLFTALVTQPTQSTKTFQEFVPFLPLLTIGWFSSVFPTLVTVPKIIINV